MRGAEVRVPAVIDPDSAARFAADFDHAASADGRGAIVLIGGEGVFCRGMYPASPTAAELLAHLDLFAECLLRIRSSSRPVIAAVDGVAMGGGVGLAATADLVIASDRSTFGLPEALFGFVPAIVLPLILERLRPSDCRLWMLTGYARSAADAHAAGLVDVVTRPDDLAREVAHSVRALSRADAAAVERVKRMTSRADLERSVRDGIRVTADMLSQPDVAGGFRQFFEDGTLPWRNQ